MSGQPARPQIVYPEPVRRPEVEAARRMQIIAAARTCIATKGYAATTIRDVAAIGGVSTGTVNYYFPNKEALLIAALKDLADETARRVHHAVQESRGDAFDALVAVVDASLPLTDDAQHMWYIWMELWDQAYRNAELGRVHATLYHGWRRLMARTIEQGITAGQFRPVDADGVARQLAGLIDGLSIHCIVGDPETPVLEVRRLCIDFLRTVLQPQDGATDDE
jgi:AcrR family transcriptional regulator